MRRRKNPQPPLDAPEVRAPDAMWKGLRVFRCGICGDRYERVENLEAVLRHEASHVAPSRTVVRASPILGPSGGAIEVEVEYDPELGELTGGQKDG